jgi:hypothetical protein
MKHVAIALSFSLLGACVATEDEDDRGDVAAEQAAASLSASTDLADISNFFKSSRDLTELSVELARTRALSDVIGALEDLVAAVDCLGIDTDNRSYVEVFFDDCGVGLLGLVRLDGSLRAELGFDTEPCGVLECPVAVYFELSTVRFEIYSGQAGLEIAGNWLIRDPLDDAEPMSSSGALVITTRRGASLSMSSSASWRIDGNQCLSLTAESQLSINALPEGAEGAEGLGTIAASVQGLERCRQECPTKGSVQVAYGAGQVLGWSYTGADTVVVTGPGGRELQVVLPCAR